MQRALERSAVRGEAQGRCRRWTASSSSWSSSAAKRSEDKVLDKVLQKVTELRIDQLAPAARVSNVLHRAAIIVILILPSLLAPS